MAEDPKPPPPLLPGYKNSDPVDVCIVIKSEKRKDEKFLNDLNSKLALISDNTLYNYDLKSKVIGTAVKCGRATYENILNVNNTLGEGILSIGDYGDFIKGFDSPLVGDIYVVRPPKEDPPKKEENPKNNENPKNTANQDDKGKPKRKREQINHMPETFDDDNWESDETYSLPTLLKKDTLNASLLDIPTSAKVKRNGKTEDTNKENLQSFKFSKDTQMLSQSPTSNKKDNRHLFHSSEGKDVTVYIIDSGANFKHTAFKRKDGMVKPGWMFGGPNPSKETKDHYKKPPNLDPKGKFEAIAHGTHVTAKIIGQSTGLARKASVYMAVAWDANGNTNSVVYLDTLIKVHEQIVNLQSFADNDQEKVDASGKKKAVICFSQQVTDAFRLKEMYRRDIWWPDYNQMPQSKRNFIDAITQVMDEVLADLGAMKNVVMVTRASGIPLYMQSNLGLGWPARRTETIKNLVLVGGVNMKGKKIMYGPSHTHVYAPAEDIQVPLFDDEGNDKGYQTVKYSIRSAVGAVSGLLASFMAEKDLDGLQAKNRLLAYAYPRVYDGYHVAFNGIREELCLTPEMQERVREYWESQKWSKNQRRAEDKESNGSYDEGEPVPCKLIPRNKPPKDSEKNVTKDDLEAANIPTMTYKSTSTDYIEIGSPTANPVAHATDTSDTEDGGKDDLEDDEDEPEFFEDDDRGPKDTDSMLVDSEDDLLDSDPMDVSVDTKEKSKKTSSSMSRPATTAAEIKTSIEPTASDRAEGAKPGSAKSTLITSTKSSPPKISSQPRNTMLWTIE